MIKNSAPNPAPLSEEQIKQGLEELLCKTLSNLTEHFDSVRILATKTMPTGRTQPFSKGEGDWFAQFGVATLFVERGKAVELAMEFARVLPRPGEDDG